MATPGHGVDDDHEEIANSLAMAYETNLILVSRVGALIRGKIDSYGA